VIEGGQVYFIRTDHIGRPVFATNDLGVKVWEASYLPFGGVHVATGGIDLRFPGQWFQAESGLYQNWMRDYDPTTGRYIQADPLGLVDGASVYGYARQNPGRWVDPRGEELYEVVAGTAGADLVTPDRSDALPLKWAGYGVAALGALAADKIIKMCLPEDECQEKLNQCLESPLAGMPGSVFGESQCVSCWKVCTNEGSWPQSIPSISGGAKICRF
jgi:RHS repeat-associated protein